MHIEGQKEQMTHEEAYTLAKRQLSQGKRKKTLRLNLKRFLPFRLFGHFVQTKCYTHIQVFALGQRATFKLWQRPSPTFYRLGKYIAANVEPISENWPVWIHRVRANYLSRNV